MEQNFLMKADLFLFLFIWFSSPQTLKEPSYRKEIAGWWSYGQINLKWEPANLYKMEMDAEPTSSLHDSLRFSALSSFFPFKTVMIKLNLWVCLRTWITFSQIASLIKEVFPSTVILSLQLLSLWAAEPDSGNTNCNMYDEILEWQH